MSAKKSFVWKYFTKLNKFQASCGICKSEGLNKILQHNQSTTPLISHLQSQHQITQTSSGSAIETGIKQTQSSSSPLQKYFKVQDTLGGFLAKWAAKNHMSVAGIVGCDELASFLSGRNMTMPRSTETAWKHIESFFESTFAQQNDRIRAKVQKGVHFSISLDEWTDINFKRFVIIFLHDSSEAFNLGLLPIPAGSCTTEVLTKQVIDCLQAEGVNPATDVVASTTDGAKTVVNIAQALKVTGQQCINHAIHLAVTDVIYKKVKRQAKAGKNLKSYKYKISFNFAFFSRAQH